MLGLATYEISRRILREMEEDSSKSIMLLVINATEHLLLSENVRG
jgi:hypothetical protein